MNAVTDFAALESLSPAQQRTWLSEWLASGSTAGLALLDYLQQRAQKPVFPQVLDGCIYQLLWQANLPEVKARFPQGVVPLQSAQGEDYRPLLDLILSEQWQAADTWTRQQLCKLAGVEGRAWLYFTEVRRLPATDLQTMDALWRLYSLGKFGFQVQRRVWLGCGRNWDKFWRAIGWYKDNTWPRYPDEFVWNLSAPAGHLPLWDQKRGVRSLEALLLHPAWERESA
ncbi:MAG: GUN4 domain-containing protein [Gloeomargarita sp. SKYG116]|nr:GUN4 domain-containing protein [Gloeomargarita sp. SKYG116]MDW8402022.1 GUN4 domain-containing protein [Gloeomargarita sp. SKYGB_i_bin116]